LQRPRSSAPKNRLRDVTFGEVVSSRCLDIDHRPERNMTTEAIRARSDIRSPKAAYSVIAFLLFAANLRPALTSVGPLLEAIRSSLGLSGTAVGLLTTLPLLIFAGFSLFARLGHVLGIERTLAVCLALIAAGIALRSQGSVPALFGGTAVFAAGIGIANVLMPVVIKRDFSRQVGPMTTAYIMVMTLTGAVATGLAVPISAHFADGWRLSLAVWALFAALTLVLWLPETRKANQPVETRQSKEAAAAKPIWQSATAWHVTIFMGLQFLIYFVTISWVPLFLADHGETATQAGWLLTLFSVMAFAAGAVTPGLLRGGRDQRALAVVASLVTALSIVGLLLAPSLASLWLFVFGGSFGVTYILAFALIGMRTSDHRRAAALSTMSQATAYLIAAAGPVVFGWLRDATGWTIPMVGLLAVAIVQSIVGYSVGRQAQA
jgi:MFS transporter, CP family, cyanate transporter